MRFSRVNWKLLSESKPETENEYLVVTETDDHETAYDIGKWYKKGATVFLEPDGTVKPKDDFERLFGPQVVIPEDGFYIITSDYGTSSDYPGCKTIPVLLESDTGNVWWTELPLEPEGTIHPYDTNREFDIKRKRYQEELNKEEESRKKAFAEYMEEAAAPDGLIDEITYSNKAEGTPDWRKWYLTNIKNEDVKDADGNIHEDCQDYKGLILKADENLAVRVMVAAGQVIDNFDIIRKEFDKETVMSAYTQFRLGKKEEYEDIYEKLVDRIKETDKAGFWYTEDKMPYIKIILSALFFAFSGDGYWYANHELKYQKNYKGKSIPEKIAIRYLLTKCAFRIARIQRLKSIPAPTIILTNEVRLLIEHIYPLFAKYEGYTNDFSEFYNFTPDGKFLGFKDEDGDREPKLPESLPEYDELGDTIPYEYDKENDVWYDMRDEEEIEYTKTLYNKISDYAKSLPDKLSSLNGNIYKDSSDYLEKVRALIGDENTKISIFTENYYSAIIKVQKAFEKHFCVVVLAVDRDTANPGFIPHVVSANGDILEEHGVNVPKDDSGNTTNVTFVIKGI